MNGIGSMKVVSGLKIFSSSVAGYVQSGKDLWCKQKTVSNENVDDVVCLDKCSILIKRKKDMPKNCQPCKLKPKLKHPLKVHT